MATVVTRQDSLQEQVMKGIVGGLACGLIMGINGMLPIGAMLMSLRS